MIELGSNLTEEDGVAEAKAPAAKASRSKPVGMPKTIRITLEENPDIPPTGLFIGHNGKGYLLRAGEPVDVPEGVVNILDDAVMAKPQVDPTTMQVLGYREQMRYPYRVAR